MLSPKSPSLRNQHLSFVSKKTMLEPLSANFSSSGSADMQKLELIDREFRHFKDKSRMIFQNISADLERLKEVKLPTVSLNDFKINELEQQMAKSTSEIEKLKSLVGGGKLKNSLQDYLSIKYQIKTLSKITIDSNLNDDFAMICMFYEAMPFLSEESTVAILEVFEDKWIKSDNPLRLKHWHNYQHKSPLILLLMDSLNNWCTRSKSDLWTNSVVKKQLIKLLKLLEIISLNLQNTVLLRDRYSFHSLVNIL